MIPSKTAPIFVLGKVKVDGLTFNLARRVPTGERISNGRWADSQQLLLIALSHENLRLSAFAIKRPN